MTTQQIFEILEADAESARFQDWEQGRTEKYRYFYLCEYGTIWRFRPQEWWRFVIRTIRNNGGYDLPLSKALRSRPKYIIRGDDRKCRSTDNTVRCVNPLDWTLDDWKGELVR